MPPLTLATGELYAPKNRGQLISYSQQFPENETNEEQDWLENAKKLLWDVSWAAYRATQTSLSSHEPAIISLLPNVYRKCSFIGYDSALYESN